MRAFNWMKTKRTAAPQAGPTHSDPSSQRVESAPVSAAAPYEDTDHKISRLEYMVEILEMQAVDLRRELAEANAALDASCNAEELRRCRAEVQEQARLLGISGSREAKLLAQVEALKVDAERYRWLRDLKCNSVTVGHDEDHACNYMTARDWIAENFMDNFNDVSPDELERMSELNSIWAIQVYPDTPIGFYKYYGATLDAAIDAARGEK